MSKSGNVSESEAKERNCPYCGSSPKNFITNSRDGTIVCSQCGTVISDKLIDMGFESSVFGPEDARKIRTGPKLTSRMQAYGVNTIISVTASDYRSHRVKNPFLVQRLRKMNSRTMFSTSKKRNFIRASQILDHSSSRLNLPSYVKEEAMKIYSYALENDLVKGRSITSIIAGAVHIALRKMGVPRQLKEIAVAFDIDEKELGKGSRLLMRRIGIKVLPANPASYVPSLCSRLGLKPIVQTIAVKLINEASKRNLIIGKDPVSTSAAAIYLTCRILKERKTQKEIAETAGVTEVTVRNRYRNMKKGLNDMITEIKENLPRSTQV